MTAEFQSFRLLVFCRLTYGHGLTFEVKSQHFTFKVIAQFEPFQGQCPT